MTEIFIHGLPNNKTLMTPLFVGKDWTDGCIAVTNNAIDEIWQQLKMAPQLKYCPETEQ